MAECVIYARVSTKEQQDEGYSIPAQVKAMEAFCSAQGLSPVARFIEAESAGRAGRREFGRMLEYLREHRGVRVVVAHKLDRLYRNFRDQITLEEDLEVRVRYVVNDLRDTPQDEFVRDMMLSQAKYYLRNLSEEVKKGMAEKVAQGGWAWRAPLGYTNDRATRSLVVNPDTAPFVRFGFERYASGLVSLSGLAEELQAMGLRSERTGRKIGVAALHALLRNPVYCGLIRYKGAAYPGAHEPLISLELFERVQETFAPNRRRNNAQKRSYVLRDFIFCAECGCKITAGTHKGLTYYRCTHGKGKDSCSQRRYVREELLMEQVEEILSRIAIPADVVDALVEEARLLEEDRAVRGRQERSSLLHALRSNEQRSSLLLDHLLNGTIDAELYRHKAEELAKAHSGLELRLRELEEPRSAAFEQVERLAKTGAGARFDFATGSAEQKREVLSEVLCNLTLEDGRIASYQYKDPFGFLERSPEGAFCHSWWAIVEAFVGSSNPRRTG